MKNKIISHEELETVVQSLRLRGLRIAMCHGVFDLLHPGHFAHFRAAKSIADIVIVSVTSDRHVNKGPQRPIFDITTRLSYLSDLDTIDLVVVSDFSSAVENIRIIKPDFYLKDQEYANFDDDITGMIKAEVEAVRSNGGEVRFTKEKKLSSTRLINEYISPFNPSISSWITNFRQKFSIDDVFTHLNLISKLDVGLIGEVIIDRYSKCSPLAKSSKDPILAFRIHESQEYRGGILAIADSLANWTNSVEVFSFTGTENQYAALGEDTMNGAKVSYRILKLEDRPTIVKHRFVEKDSQIRLFETYDFDPRELEDSSHNEFWKSNLKKISEKDCVVVADYGHGLMSEDVRRIVENNARNLAVNVQANAGNRGFNTITKYTQMDLMCLNGAEFQLELRSSNPDYFRLIPQYMERLGSKYAIVTLGGAGMLVFDNKGNFTNPPAFASQVIDKVGAGDSVLAIASLLASVEAPIEVIGLLASIVAAHEVGQLGHQASISKVDLQKSIRAILG